MTQDTWNYIFIGLSFATYIIIALKSRAGSTKEYYTAGGGVSPFANGMATAADWMSAATFISMAGSLATKGFDGSRYLMGWTGGFVLLTVLMVPYLRKFGKATVPDFIGDRFYSKTARFIAVLCALFICITYLMGQMNGVGVVFSQLFGLELSTGVIIGGSIVFFYAGLGGMKGITYTQVAQYCVMAFAYTIPAILVAMALTGNLFPQFGIIGDYKPDGSTAVPLLEKVNNINTELGFAKYTDGSLSKLNMFCITAALMAGTAGLPHVIVRFFTVKDVKAVRKSACWTLAFIAVIYLTAPAVGLFSRVNLVEKLTGKDLQGVSYAEAPQWFKDFENTGQMAWVDKNGDGKIQYYGSAIGPETTSGKVFSEKKPIHKKDANDEVVRGQHGEIMLENNVIDIKESRNELFFGSDIMVMANPHMGGLPRPVIGLLMAGCIAAALSTAAGLILVLSSAISHDLMKRIVNPELTEKQEIRWARGASFGALLVGIYFGINPPGDFVAQTVAFAFGLAASSFFPTLLMGIFSKKMNRLGAMAGMASGILFTLSYIIYFQFMGGDPKDYLFDIHPEGIGSLGMVINFVVAFAVNAFTGDAPEEVQEMVESIHIPSGAGEASHH